MISTRLLIISIFFLVRVATSWGQSFTQEEDAIRLRRGEDSLSISPNGGITAAFGDKAAIEWGIAFWYDRKGYVDQRWVKRPADAKLDADGKIHFDTGFANKEADIPIRLTQTVSALSDGIEVTYTFQKTGAVSLDRGIRAAIRLPHAALKGRRLVTRPGRIFRIPGSLNSVAKGMSIEMVPGKCVSFEFDAPRALHLSAAGEKESTLHVAMSPQDFGAGETVTATMRVRFADLPDVLPGEVRGMKAPLAIRAVTPSATQLPKFGKLEVHVDLGATYDNPFDPDQVALGAMFTSPSGKEIHVPGFHGVDYQRTVTPQGEMLEPGAASWRVRFTPIEAGQYSYSIRLRDKSGDVERGLFSLAVADAPARGFVRIGRNDPHYLEFDNGEPLFVIGHNLPTYHSSDQLADDALRRMAAAGENYNRWWMYSYALGLEWEEKVGWYRMDEAWRLDHVMDLAEELGMYYMLCMDTHQDFLFKKSWDRWHTNPFNAALGGPCKEAPDWLTDPTARAAYRKRLRYTVARWGYSPHVLVWEFGNEFEGWPGTLEQKLDWHKEVSAYLKEIDPYHHLVSTSFWNHTGPKEFWELPTMDVVQTHCYTNNDEGVAEQVSGYCLEQWQSFRKPHIFGEFGIRSHGTTADQDPEGWALHNAYYAGALSFSAGIPMPWWHESYIDKLDLYFHFTSIRNFMKGLPLSTANWRKLEADPPEFVDKNRPPKILDLKVLPRFAWGKPTVNRFTVGRDGSITDAMGVPSLLHGKAHTDIRDSFTFVVDYPKDGKFLVHVGDVSAGGMLRIWLDEKLLLAQELPCDKGLGQKSEWKEEWKLWQTTYDKDFGIDVPAGKHEIRLDNDGKDWIRAGHYLFTSYRTIVGPDLVVLGMQNDAMALIWAQNRESTWKNHAGKLPYAPVAPSLLTVRGLSDGPRSLEWWETWKGTIAKREVVEVKGKALTIQLPEMKTDVALKIMPIGPDQRP